MSKAVDDLKNEHEAIRLTLSVLDSMVSLLKGGDDVSRKDLGDLVGFLSEFGDKCHHGKEEYYLFPALENRGIYEADNLIATLSAEHDLARNLTHRMADSLENLDTENRFVDSAEEYAGMLRAHIDREDAILFPLVEAHLPPSLLDDIYGEFEDHEEQVIGAGRHEELHRMLDGFRERYLP